MLKLRFYNIPSTVIYNPTTTTPTPPPPTPPTHPPPPHTPHPTPTPHPPKKTRKKMEMVTVIDCDTLYKNDKIIYQWNFSGANGMSRTYLPSVAQCWARYWNSLWLLPKHALTSPVLKQPWWRHQMETFSALLALLRGIHRSPVNSLHKDRRHGALKFFFNLCLNKRLSKQSWCWWFETPSRSLWRDSNGNNLAWVSI